MAKDKNTTEKKNIKNYGHYLWIFILLNFCVFLSIDLGKNINFNNISEIYKSLIVKDSIVPVASTIVTFILNGLLTSDFKYILVFWRIKDPLPGCRIFTELIDKDYRIDKNVLIKKYGTLPIKPKEQNKLWYKIYKQNEFDPMIFDSQRSFLLSRDLTGLSFLFLIIYTITILVSGVKFSIALAYIGFLLIQYMVLALVCRHYGTRFSLNAIARICSIL